MKRLHLKGLIPDLIRDKWDGSVNGSAKIRENSLTREGVQVKKWIKFLMGRFMAVETLHLST